ncbi:hypothetical protein NECAME_03557 [Necator americanus]|uniref:Uncharacterized protein n=1 Tax=Necator americanus TaxID=51031 RepID=W2T355_NECAM|nr:hypothetical protein NECAME_03557 [Necator americanus]ETN75994.1 hypothetical protein NECAME_03557 [Necator americanus]
MLFKNILLVLEVLWSRLGDWCKQIYVLRNEPYCVRYVHSNHEDRSIIVSVYYGSKVPKWHEYNQVDDERYDRTSVVEKGGHLFNLKKEVFGREHQIFHDPVKNGGAPETIVLGSQEPEKT